MSRFRLASGRLADHEDADELTLFTVFDLRTGDIVTHGRASTLALAKEQERAAGIRYAEGPPPVAIVADDTAHISFVLGHWNPRYWRVEDGGPVSRRSKRRS